MSASLAVDYKNYLAIAVNANFLYNQCMENLANSMLS